MNNQQDYSKDPVLLRDAHLFAQRQTACIFSTIADMGFVLAAMPLMDIHKVDTKFWCPWEDVETGRLTEQEGERLEPIALSEAGLFEVCTRDSSGDIMEILGYFERPQLIDLITGKLPFDKLRSQAIQYAIRNAVIEDTVKYAPEGFDLEAAKLSGQIQKAKSSLRYSGLALDFASSLAGVQPSQEMIDKSNREKQELQDKLTDLQAQWLTCYGMDYQVIVIEFKNSWKNCCISCSRNTTESSCENALIADFNSLLSGSV